VVHGDDRPPTDARRGSFHAWKLARPEGFEPPTY
jgi:hypothetical protein